MYTLNLTARQLLDLYTSTNDAGIREAILVAMDPESARKVAVRMIHWGDDKIGSIKIVRTFTQMGLKDAKDFCEGVGPVAIIKMMKEDAEKMAQELDKITGALIHIEA